MAFSRASTAGSSVTRSAIIAPEALVCRKSICIEGEAEDFRLINFKSNLCQHIGYSRARARANITLAKYWTGESEDAEGECVHVYTGASRLVRETETRVCIRVNTYSGEHKFVLNLIAHICKGVARKNSIYRLHICTVWNAIPIRC